MAKEESRRGYNRLDGIKSATCPTDKIYVWVNEKDLRETYKHARFRFFNLTTAAEVLRNPKRIRKGIREDRNGNMTEGWVYLGHPKDIRDSNNNKVPLGSGNIFLAFLNKDNVLIEWRKERVDPADPLEPLVMEDQVEHGKLRFGEITWTAQPT